MKHIKFIIAILILGSCGQSQNGQTKDLDSTSSHKTNNHPKTTEKPTKEESNNERWFEPEKLDTTLYFSDSLQLTLKITDSISINEYFLDSEIIDSLKKPHNNRHLEALEIERYQLKTFSNVVKQDTNGLHLKLENGDWKLLTLDTTTIEADNTFEFYFKDYGFYSIRVQWSEGNGYKLVNSFDGTETDLFGRPYFSPNGKLIISVNADIDAGYSPNGFQLFANNNGNLRLLGNYKPTGWGPYSVKWLSNNQLIMKNQTFEIKNGTMDYANFYTKMIINNGG